MMGRAKHAYRECLICRAAEDEYVRGLLEFDH